ncbi:hypothetical protein LC612_21155 [Nostoc sp. CHAB 5834]|nr:hypothetical protein [Nostoc sp. CHAB 5834]
MVNDNSGWRQNVIQYIHLNKYIKQQQPHLLKDKTGDDYDQSERGNIPQMCDASNGTVGDRGVLSKPATS